MTVSKNQKTKFIIKDFIGNLTIFYFIKNYNYCNNNVFTILETLTKKYKFLN